MNTQEFIKTLSERLDLPQAEVKVLVKDLSAIFSKNLEDHKSFTIPRLGTFGARERKHRKSFNPHFKEMMLLPNKISAIFRSAKSMREKTYKENS